MLTIRLRRMGKRDRAFYRFVVSDSRKTPTASAVEEVGHYDPLHKEIQLDRERIDYWVGNGATLSNSVKTLIHRADHGGLAKPGTAAKAEPTATQKEATPKEAAPKEEATPETAKKEAKDDEAAEKKAEETKAEAKPPEATKAADAKAGAATTGAAETKSAEQESAEAEGESAKEDTESA